jgi:ribonuclease D
VGRSITKEEISKLDVEEFKGRIFVIDNLEDLETAIEYLSGFKILGFDTETRPAFKKGNIHSVALIQLSTADQCFLFRLNIIGFSPLLISLLSNPNVLKIGLSLKDDYTSMGRRIKFMPQGFIDLQKVVSNHDISDISLQKIYAILFQKKISKSQRLSNWEAVDLSEAQKKYAALDAWACLKIYEYLCPTNKSI